MDRQYKRSAKIGPARHVTEAYKQPVGRKTKLKAITIKYVRVTKKPRYQNIVSTTKQILAKNPVFITWLSNVKISRLVVGLDDQTTQRMPW